MKQLFSKGDKKQYIHIVNESDFVSFGNEGILHQVYSTYAITRDAEWSCRLFVLDMKEPHEEGIGCYIEVHHKSPAFAGDSIIFTSTFFGIERHNIVCGFEAYRGPMLISHGITHQRILSKNKLHSLLLRK